MNLSYTSISTFNTMVKVGNPVGVHGLGRDYLVNKVKDLLIPFQTHIYHLGKSFLSTEKWLQKPGRGFNDGLEETSLSKFSDFNIIFRQLEVRLKKRINCCTLHST